MNLRFFFTIFLLVASGCKEAPSLHETIAEDMSDAYINGGFVPMVSEDFPDVSIGDAYLIQKYFVNSILKNDEIAGYKTGLASKVGQSKYHVDSPIAGVLFLSGKNIENTDIRASEYYRMLVETEIGYKIGKEITSPIKDVKELEEKIESIIPVIELPDVRFKNIYSSKLTDVVAANICSYKFILGKEFNYRDFSSLNFDIELIKNEKTINSASIKDEMEYQKYLLMWLINNRLENGWELLPGQLLITGAINRINVGNKGNYQADYGPLGKIEFTVR